MRFRSTVEPPEPMRGLEVPREVVDALGGGARPPVIITLNGHSWKSRIAIMRGRHLIGLSIANRHAAGVEIGDEVEVGLELDTAPRVVIEPAEFARALDAAPAARRAFDQLAHTHKRDLVLTIASAKMPATRARRIENAVGALPNGDLAVGRKARSTSARRKP
jgi:hypothetical protein